MPAALRLIPWFRKQISITCQHSILRTADPKASTASPLFADLSGLAPIYIQVGDAETLLDDSLSFAERAKNAGLDVKLDHYPDMIHIWPYFWPMLSEGRDAIAKLADFCRARLNK